MTNTSLKNWAVMIALALGAPAIMANPTESSAAAPQAEETGTATGTIVDSFGDPLTGATIRVEGTSLAAAADVDGKFSIPGVKVGSKLTVSFIGYAPVTVTWNGQPLDITMDDDSSLLEEVVVLGYGITQKRTNVTNSVAKVADEVLTIGANANPAQALVGAVSGVKVYVTSGNPGATPTIEIRGGTNYNASNAPLYVVDGQIRESLADINPNDIESMDVLKDAGATAIYGARAGNGVVIITTKHGKAGEGKVTFNMKVGINSYMDQGYDMATPEQWLYYYRVGNVNSGWAWPGTLGAGYPTSGNNNINGVNNPGGVVRTQIGSDQQYNIMLYNDALQYLVDDYGWSVVDDPISNNRILYKDTDLLKWNLNKLSYTQDYNLSFSGGNDRGNYYASLGYYNADGAVLGTYYTRYNFAMTGEYRLTNWLTSNSTFTFVRSNWLTDNPIQGTAYMMNRGRFWMFARMENEEGTLLRGNGSLANIKMYQDTFDRDNETDKFQFTQSLTVNILPEFQIKGTVSWLYSESTGDALNRDYTQLNGALNVSHAASNSFSRYFDQTYNVVANYHNTFAEKHNVNVMVGAELYRRKYWGFSASGSGAVDAFQDLALTEQDTRSIDSFHNREALISYFGRVEYNYANRYLLAATFRTDGYSRLINNKWGTFPGVSAGWVMSEENFWKESPINTWWNYAKVRGSFGFNATINSGYLGYYTLQGSYASSMYNGNRGYRYGSPANPGLRWERTRTGEVGLTFGFLQNRLNLDVTYYNRLTMDKYGSQSLPQTTGFSSITTNVGQYRNQGVEIDVHTTLYRNKDWQWTLGGNITYNQNTVVKLPYSGLENNRQINTGVQVYNPNWDGVDPDSKYMYIGGVQEGQNPFQQVGYGKGGYVQTWADVEALGDFIELPHNYGSFSSPAIYATEAGRQRLLAMGYGRTGMRQLTPGSYYYQDMNGDNMIDSFDRKVIGNNDPHWTGGFNTQLTWKGLSLYARFDMGFGFQVYDSNISFLLGEGQGSMAFPSQVTDTWKADKPNAKYPSVVWASQYGTDSYTRPSEFWAQNGNYLACRELSLSYQLPSKITEKFKCQGLTVSVTGQNLGYIKSCTIPLPDNVTYWTGNTAGDGGTYNLPKTVIFGLNVSF